MENKQDIIKSIRSNTVDMNNQELFISTVLKGLILKLNQDISIRNIPVPHIIAHTGSDALYLEHKKYNNSIEPYETSNESYIYNVVPRCNIKMNNIDLVPDQLTNPYSIGNFQYESQEMIYKISAEFRRMPIKIGIDLTYSIGSHRDYLELLQQILSKLAFIQIYNITYLGQLIKCSYKIPESFSGEHVVELTGDTKDDKNYIANLSIEIETNFPIISNETAILADQFITKISVGDKILFPSSSDNNDSIYIQALNIRNGILDRNKVTETVLKLADNEAIKNEDLEILDMTTGIKIK